MSVWTHINAQIRIDHIRPIMGEMDFSFLGEIITFETEGHWDTILPLGSEGSLEYKITKNPELSHMAAYVVSFFGDLRDYEDVKEIMEYFTKICEGKMIRNGVVEIEVSNTDEVFVYKWVENEFIRMQ